MPQMPAQQQVPGTVDFFLKCTDVQGESEDASHRNEIEIDSWSWEVTSPRDAATHLATGRYRLANLKVTVSTNRGSIQLISALTRNEAIREVKLTCRRAGSGKAGAKPGEYLVITLTDAHVAGVRIGAEDDGSGTVDEIEFGYQSILLDYKPQKSDGTLGEHVSATLDVMRDK